MRVKDKPKQAVILCGGIGSRLRPYTYKTPKPMIMCNGKPFLWYLLTQLHEQGVKNFILLTGYLSEHIVKYFNDGSDWGWNIQYSDGPVGWDTGKRIWKARKKINNKFLLLYSDNFSIFPFDKVFSIHENNNSLLTFVSSEKSPGNIELNNSNIVQKYDNNRSDKNLNYVEIGYMIVEKKMVLNFFKTPNCSFSEVLQRISSRGKVCSWVQKDAYYSISDPERWKICEKYLKPKKILLIDRDGIINHKAPKGEYISNWKDFAWIRDTYKSMKYLSRFGFKFIIISNQAGIARKMIEQKDLDDIHFNMKMKFKTDGIDILDIYICPHHWEDECFCRKPNPGMLIQASKDHLFRLDKTIFIGDDIRDVEAADNANCKSILISSEYEDYNKNQNSLNKSYLLFSHAINYIQSQFK